MLCNLFAEKQINRNVKNFRKLNKHIKVGLGRARGCRFPKSLQSGYTQPRVRPMRAENAPRRTLSF